MNTEQVKQQVILELENSRMWGAFLLPGIALDLTLFFTDKLFADNILLRYLLGAYVFILMLFVFYKRNQHITKARDYIKQLK